MKKDLKTERTTEAQPEAKRRLPKGLKLTLLILGILIVLGGAAFLIVRQIIKDHTERIERALAGTQDDLYTLFADDTLLQTLWNNAGALYESEGLDFEGEAVLSAQPHVVFRAPQPQWQLTVSGARDAGVPCCAGTLRLGTDENDRLSFSFNDERLQLQLHGLGVCGASLAELEAQGVSLPGLLRFDAASDAHAALPADGTERASAQGDTLDWPLWSAATTGTERASAQGDTAGAASEVGTGTRTSGSTRRFGEPSITVEKNERRTHPDGQYLLQTLFEGGSGETAGKTVLTLDGGAVECDHYRAHWKPEQAAAALDTLGLSALRERTLLLDDRLAPDQQTLALLWAAVRDGTVDRDGLLCAVVARLLLDFEPTAQIYLAGDRVRGLDLKRSDSGAKVSLRLMGEKNVLTHVQLTDADIDGTLDFRYASGSLLELTLQGSGKTRTLLRFEEADGSFRIDVGDDETQQLEGVLLPAGGGITLEYRSGALLLAPIAFEVPLPKVEFLWIKADDPPLEFSLQPTRITLTPQRQKPQMLQDGDDTELMKLPLLDAVQIVIRLYEMLQEGIPLRENEALAGSYELLYAERDGMHFDPSILGLEPPSFTLNADGSCSALNLATPGMTAWTHDETTVTLQSPLGLTMQLEIAGETLRCTEALTGITFVFEKTR